MAEHLIEVSCGYSTLEYDLDSGKRGTRYSHVEALLCELTGAEAALVVNNNAAAVMLVLSTLCAGKEVIVSRGQLVEIGGAFRIPDVMRASGAALVEVGTTNKTHLRDYAMAITDQTSAILKVHTSNYRILGFTSEVEIETLATLCREKQLPLIEDLGSGSLFDLSKYGLMKEPTVVESMLAGADVVTFSGDKMLGGPQAGIILGKKTYIDAMKKNQLTRALRVDKMTLSALEATLKLYRDPQRAIFEIPTLRMLTEKPGTILPRAEMFLSGIQQIGESYEAQLIETMSEVGGGSLPLEQLPTWAVTLRSLKMTTQTLTDALRHCQIPVIVRVSEDRLIFDLRTIQEHEAEEILSALRDLA
jgi:L-seryl-tRNA(Ser) seleniumtransferase